jgi:hypothetical protein
MKQCKILTGRLVSNFDQRRQQWFQRLVTRRPPLALTDQASITSDAF